MPSDTLCARLKCGNRGMALRCPALKAHLKNRPRARFARHLDHGIVRNSNALRQGKRQAVATIRPRLIRPVKSPWRPVKPVLSITGLPVAFDNVFADTDVVAARPGLRTLPITRGRHHCQFWRFSAWRQAGPRHSAVAQPNSGTACPRGRLPETPRDPSRR